MTTELSDETFDAFVEGNRRAIIDCWAPWCGPCKRLGPVIEELEGELGGEVAVGKVDVDSAPGVSARFRISAIPTVLFYLDGVVVEQVVGLRPKGELLAIARSKLGVSGGAPAPPPAADARTAARALTDADFAEFCSKGRVLVDCWAPWCKPCQRMGPIVEKLAQISQGEISVGKLDIDENRMTAMRFGIESIPTLLIFKDGRQADVIVGLDPGLTPEALREYILGL